MERFARLVMHHRRIVSAVWLVLFLGGMFFVNPLSERSRSTVPGEQRRTTRGRHDPAQVRAGSLSPSARRMGRACLPTSGRSSR